MKIKFLNTKDKICKGTIKIGVNRIPVFVHADCCTTGYWWVDDFKKWMTLEEANKTGSSYSSCSCPLYSVRAFKRRLKQWSKYMPKGTEFILKSNFIGYDVKGKI